MSSRTSNLSNYTKKEQKSQITNIKEKNRRKFVTIQESNVKPKREPSEYAKLNLELRISNNAKLPSFYKRNQVQQRLLKATEERYDRYYRKIEDFFAQTELKFFVSLFPNETLTDFSIDYWGLGFKSNSFTIFYAGTKLNDLGSFESKVLEKHSDVIKPYRLFNGYNKQLNFDSLNLGQLLEILKLDWIKYANQNNNIVSITYSELYTEFKKFFFKK
jgi:hypothetical protein